MMIDWTHFTPWASLVGGVLIGLTAALFLLFNGRIAGISGILGGLLEWPRGDFAWRIPAMLVGMAIFALIERVSTLRRQAA